MKCKNYSFQNTDSCSLGTMICTKCKIKISNCDYMSWEEHENGDLIAYRTQHLSCALSDKQNVIRYADKLKKDAIKLAEKQSKLSKEKTEAIKMIHSAKEMVIDGNIIYLDDECY